MELLLVRAVMLGRLARVVLYPTVIRAPQANLATESEADDAVDKMHALCARLGTSDLRVDGRPDTPLPRIGLDMTPSNRRNALLNHLTSALDAAGPWFPLRNRLRMLLLAIRIRPTLAKPPGSDEGFSPTAIARYAESDFSGMTTWSIICEEMLDTQHPRAYFQRAREELLRRGIAEGEIRGMRRFAWLTAGWLNFEMKLWDWASLDEKDILLAIDWQHRDGWISTREKSRRVKYMRRYSPSEPHPMSPE